MTRSDKRAARFGDRYQPPIDWRRFRDGLQKAQPAIHRMTEAFRRHHEAQLVADDATLSRVWFAPVGTTAPTLAELEWSPLGYASEDGIGWDASEWTRQTGVTIHRGHEGPSVDILDRIDADLLSYDSQHADGSTPWPYGGAF